MDIDIVPGTKLDDLVSRARKIIAGIPLSRFCKVG